MQAPGINVGSSRSYEEGHLGRSSVRPPYGDAGSGRGGSYTALPGWQAHSGGGNSGHPGQGSISGAGELGPGGGPSGSGGALGPGGYGFGDYSRSSGARVYDGGREQRGREQERHTGRRGECFPLYRSVAGVMLVQSRCLAVICRLWMMTGTRPLTADLMNIIMFPSTCMCCHGVHPDLLPRRCFCPRRVWRACSWQWCRLRQRRP